MIDPPILPGRSSDAAVGEYELGRPGYPRAARRCCLPAEAAVLVVNPASRSPLLGLVAANRAALSAVCTPAAAAGFAIPRRPVARRAERVTR